MPSICLNVQTRYPKGAVGGEGFEESEIWFQPWDVDGRALARFACAEEKEVIFGCGPGNSVMFPLLRTWGPHEAELDWLRM